MKSHLQNKKSLGVQLLIRVLIFSSSLTAALTLLNFAVDYKNEMSKLDESISYLGNASIPPLAQALWNFDHDQVRTHVKALLTHEHVYRIKVINEKNEVVYNEEKSSQKNQWKKKISYKLNFREQGQIQNLGKLELFITQDPIINELLMRLSIFFVSQGVKTFIISLFIMFIFYRLVGEKVVKISQHLESLTLTNPQPLPTKIWEKHPESEMESLGLAINKLLTRLRQLNELNGSTLQNSESHMAYAQKVAKLGHWVFELETYKFERSRELDKIFGVSFGEEIHFEAFFQVFNDEDTKRWEAAINECFRYGTSFDLQLEGNDHRGKHHWYNIRGQRSLDQKKLTGTCQDITDLIEFETDQVRKTKQLKSIVEIQLKLIETPDDLPFLRLLMTILEETKSEFGFIFSADENKTFKPLISSGLNLYQHGQFLNELFLNRIFEDVIIKKENLLLNNLTPEDKHSYKLRSFLGIPIFYQGEYVGAICIGNQHKRQDRFDLKLIDQLSYYLQILGHCLKRHQNKFPIPNKESA